MLRSWEMSTGVLKWELLLELPPETNKRCQVFVLLSFLNSITNYLKLTNYSRNYPLNVSWRPGSALATLTGKNGGKKAKKIHTCRNVSRSHMHV